MLSQVSESRPGAPLFVLLDESLTAYPSTSVAAATIFQDDSAGD
jgi:hypothetical protein